MIHDTHPKYKAIPSKTHIFFTDTNQLCHLKFIINLPMAVERPTRSTDVTKVLLDQPYKEEYMFVPSGKLKNGHFVISRMVFL